MSENTSSSQSPFESESNTTWPFYTSFDTDGDADAAVVTIVESVAAVTNSSPLEMPPLYHTIHTGALGELVSTTRESRIEIEFVYVDCRVTVSSDGDIIVYPPTE